MKTSALFKNGLLLWLVSICTTSHAQINSPNGQLKSNSTNTNIGIGTASYPANMLHIQSPAQKDSAERLFRVTVGDASGDFFQVNNGSADNFRFSPVLWGHRESVNPDGSNGAALVIKGSTNIANDVAGSPAVVQFSANSFSNSGLLMGVPGHPEIAIDPTGETAITERPLFDWKSGQTLEMRMMPNGTLGIGNSAPNNLCRLDVGGDIVIGSATNGSNRLLLHTRAWLGGDFFALAPSFPGNSSGFDFSNGIFIVPGKGVGIGTGNLVGNAKFAVAGKMYAEQIIVKLQANWPDNVFGQDYKLRSINELATYLSAHKHLPEIPSENEIKETGIDLGNMQKLQMQKIEELSLYIIQLHKENEALKQRLEKVEKKVK